MTTIKEMTKDCPRQDCVIVCDGGTTTLIGWSQAYDKEGNPIGEDPNITTMHHHCRTCGRKWSHRSGGRKQ